MLTQMQTIERQAALLAACPRPRALALVPAPVNAVLTVNPVTAAVPAACLPSPTWSHVAPISHAAFARVPGFGVAGYAAAPRPMAGVRPDSAARREGHGIVGLSREYSSTFGTEQQDQKHLTTRRGPVTWRPPH
jgi:hypothetical protein